MTFRALIGTAFSRPYIDLAGVLAVVIPGPLLGLFIAAVGGATPAGCAVYAALLSGTMLVCILAVTRFENYQDRVEHAAVKALAARTPAKRTAQPVAAGRELTTTS